jgi:solute carrier family 25 carnitine/acylcarnitine transporter 20/29
MASPLVGMTGVNSLLFASYGAAKRLISPFPELTIPQTAVAGALAGTANAVLASPGASHIDPSRALFLTSTNAPTK